MTHAGGRPPKYDAETIKRADEYLSSCVDYIDENKRWQVKFPSHGGLALALGVNRDTLYEWAKVHEGFSDILQKLLAKQEEKLLSSGLSGAYNPTIAKVVLTKHGYREGMDHTTNDKDLPAPILQLDKTEG